jgi:hypothetical protein
MIAASVSGCRDNPDVSRQTGRYRERCRGHITKVSLDAELTAKVIADIVARCLMRSTKHRRTDCRSNSIPPPIACLCEGGFATDGIFIRLFRC